jgi:hypothetical protein
VISCSREVNASGIENVLLIIVFLRNPNPWAAVYDVPHTKDVMAITKTRFLPPRAMAIDARVRCLRRVLLAIWPVSRRAISTRIFRRSPNHQDFGPFPPGVFASLAPTQCTQTRRPLRSRVRRDSFGHLLRNCALPRCRQSVPFQRIKLFPVLWTDQVHAPHRLGR